MRLALALLCVACGSSSSPEKLQVVVADAELRAVVEEFVGFVPHEGIRVAERGTVGLRVTVVIDLEGCVECWRLDGAGDEWTIRAADVLGAQYGLADFLEQLGFRFYHPFRTEVPDRFATPVATDVQAPEESVRGLHLHTLHPIEGYYAFWEPGDGEAARRIVDWTIKNRGNFINVFGLDDILRLPERAGPWQEHMSAVIDGMHRRGVRAGVSVQIFGSSNLQSAFDLIDDEKAADPLPEIERRLGVLMDGVAWDAVMLTFGEFFGAEPQTFIDAINLVHGAIVQQSPGIEVAANIHVGDEQRVTYMGEEMLYYFLVQYADPAIVPSVHTVMYYNLFEDAGGAYHHDDFAEHRDFLLERIAAGERVIYHPESAYWVAFDNSVPTWLPLYIRSRWLDMAMAPGLDEQLLFSSGWEWGYWQNDRATLRAMFRLPPRWEDLIEEMFAPGVAAQVIATTELQHEYLIERRLAAYMASRDVYIDLGAELDIVSQPERPSFEEVAAMTEAEKAAFVADVLVPLEEFAAASNQIAEAMPRGDIWSDEVSDGAQINAARLDYIHALYRAVLEGESWLGIAEAARARAEVVVARRHGALHHPDAASLIGRTTNQTITQFGYLEKADTLCYWEREWVQTRAVVVGESMPAPGCVF